MPAPVQETNATWTTNAGLTQRIFGPRVLWLLRGEVLCFRRGRTREFSDEAELAERISPRGAAQ